MDHLKILYILCGGLVFFTLAVVAAATFFPSNASIYALFAGILGNFSGALFTWLQVNKPKQDQ